MHKPFLCWKIQSVIWPKLASILVCLLASLVGSGDLNAEGAKTPGTALGLAALIATHNPVGLIVSGGIHAYGEATGSSKLEGRAKQTAKEISEVLKKRFQEQDWI